MFLSLKKTDQSWSGICDDLLDVHSGLASSCAGSKGSFFATMAFVNGEIRPLGYNVLNNILKIAETEPDFNLHHLVTLYDTFATTPAEFVGYAGAKSLFTMFQKVSSLIRTDVLAQRDSGEARQDFLAMLSSFARYVNLLNAQNLHMFPWVHTKEYPIGVPVSEG